MNLSRVSRHREVAAPAVADQVACERALGTEDVANPFVALGDGRGRWGGGCEGGEGGEEEGWEMHGFEVEVLSMDDVM